jgi:hypothetical protein
MLAQVFTEEALAENMVRQTVCGSSIKDYVEISHMNV